MNATAPSKDGPLWLLFDGNNHCHRDWHAGDAAAADLFARRLELLRDKLKAERVAVCFDSRQSFRREFCDEYKAHRDETPEGVRDCLEAVRAWCLDNAVDVCDSVGFEADDVLATLTVIGLEQDRRVVLASTDKDLRQLLDAGRVVQLLSTRRRGKAVSMEWMNAANVQAVYGVEPWQWIDFQTLVGDKVDGIRGADGIGPETAKRILQRCHTLDGYYANQWAANLSQRQHASLAKFRDRYKTVRRLVTLRRDVPLPAAWRDTAGAEP